MEKILLVLLIGLSVMISCNKLLPKSPDDSEMLDGPVDGLSDQEMKRFLEGDAAFKQVFTSQNGLGSTFVATSCVACHAGDGKGHPSTTLTRFGQPDEFGNQFLNQGGPQLQNRAIPGHSPEMIPAGATFAKFTPPANTGLGFLDFVTDEDILAMSDPNDANGDGISGTVNWIDIPDYTVLRPGAISNSGKYIGRFGKKSAAYDLLHQTVNAYNQDMGIASSYNPKDVASGLDTDPEVINKTVQDLVFYLRTLKAPIQRNKDNADVLKGQEIFNQISCVSCHRPQLKTGFSPISALSNKEFYPYTDMLMHDMGAELDDHYTEGSAKTSEWRTPPLWGLGLSKKSQGGQYYLMHDGRANTLQQAILLHGGEATASKNLFKALSDLDKSALFKFLESL